MKLLQMELTQSETFEVTEEVILDMETLGLNPNDIDDLFNYFYRDFSESLDLHKNTLYWIE